MAGDEDCEGEEGGEGDYGAVAEECVEGVEAEGEGGGRLGRHVVRVTRQAGRQAVSLDGYYSFCPIRDSSLNGNVQVRMRDGQLKSPACFQVSSYRCKVYASSTSA